MSFYSDPNKFGRILKDSFVDNFNYSFCDGELDPDNNLIWTSETSSFPFKIRTTISEAEAIYILLNKCWPNLISTNYKRDEAISIIEGILYGGSLKRKGILR